MQKSMIFSPIFILIPLTSLILSGCAPKPTTASTQTAPATISPTDIAVLSPTPNQAATATSKPTPFPSLTLKPGDYYFSLDEKPGFIFSRNVAGNQLVQYDTFLDWTKAGGSKIARIQLDSLGMGYTINGAVDQNWATEWDQVFDKAQAEGIYILPVFSGWFDWNAGTGYSTWKSNPLNQANGGPVKTPTELFQTGSATQTLWLQWMETLVQRWQGRKNILAWEIFSEVNLASGTTEAAGIDFVNSAASIIRTADPSKRPVTASIADTGTWPNFYRNTSIDFINLHPYPPSAQLDRAIISEVHNSLVKYNRPVLIGESGLSADTPDSAAGKLTIAPNAPIGTRHAIWAAIVSGAMNGRSLYWEDSFGIYFPSLGIPWMQKYETEELPAVNFVSGVDFSGFKPLTTVSTNAMWGSSVGNEKVVLGWYRDALCEPPDWNLQPIISKQTVTITIPGTAANWQVDFYDTKNGTTKLSSVSVNRKGSTITVPLPDFQDDIAFKMTTQAGTASTSAPDIATTDSIAGAWSGTISNLAGTFSTSVKLSIQAGCQPGQACGTFSAPQLPCSGELLLKTINDGTFLFLEQNVSGAASCKSGGYEQIHLLSDGTLLYEYLIRPGSAATSTGILKNPAGS